jgi:hypothetical protein
VRLQLRPSVGSRNWNQSLISSMFGVTQFVTIVDMNFVTQLNRSIANRRQFFEHLRMTWHCNKNSVLELSPTLLSEKQTESKLGLTWRTKFFIMLSSHSWMFKKLSPVCYWLKPDSELNKRRMLTKSIWIWILLYSLSTWDDLCFSTICHQIVHFLFVTNAPAR